MMPCAQCGRERAWPVGRALRRVRYACRRCGAVFRIARRDVRVATPFTADPLTEVMPVRMARWLRQEHPDEELAIPAQRAAIIELYGRFDQFTLAARDSLAIRKRFEEISDVPPEPVTDFGKALIGIMAACFDPELAQRRIGGGPLDLERLEHARRWLAGPGRHCAWIHLEAEPLVPDPKLARALLDPGALTGRFDRDRASALHAALFGVERGPQVRSLVEQFTEEGIQDAIRGYLADGSRPLRTAVLARLEADGR